MQRFKGADGAFFVVSPYMMDALPTFREALKPPVISLFFSVVITAKECFQFIYHLSNLLMESVNKRWAQHPADITATFYAYK